jgi:hypothetical protein
MVLLNTLTHRVPSSQLDQRRDPSWLDDKCLLPAVKPAVEMQPFEHKPFRRLSHHMGFSRPRIRRGNERHTAMGRAEIKAIQLDQVLDKGTSCLVRGGRFG